jgi:choice-of-anchor C domain-containing protein
MRLINMRKAAVLAMLFTGVLGPSKARAQLLVNGNFEAGPGIPPIQAVLAVGVGGTALTGWSVVGGAVTIVTENYWVPLSGARSVVLSSGAGPGGIQQVFATSPGAVYRLTFWQSGEPFSLPALKTLRVNAGATQQDFTFDNAPAWHWDMAWAQHSLDFGASGASTTLRFSATDAAQWCAAVDSAKVELVTAGVPAGQTLSLSRVSPDPVRVAAQLAFTLALPGRARLAVYDVQGRELALLADGDFGAGPHEISFDPRRIGANPGLYFAELRAGGGSFVRRFTVLH